MRFEESGIYEPIYPTLLERKEDSSKTYFAEEKSMSLNSV